MIVIEYLLITLCGLFVGWTSVVMFCLAKDAMKLYNKKGDK